MATTLTPSSASPGAAATGSTTSLSITWTAVSNDPSWLSVTPASGSGNAQITWAALANNTSQVRTGTLTIAGQIFTVTQSGVGPVDGEWVKRFGSSGVDVGQAVAVDPDGNIFLTGYFYGIVDFSSGTQAALTATPGGVDIFLAKFSPLGSFIWAKRFGSSGNEQVLSIALDNQNNIFLAGFFTGVGNFGGSDFVSTGQQDAFLSKYDASGNHIWSKTFGSTSADVISQIATDSQGSVIATGYFLGTVNFGSVTLSSAFNSTDIFISKYSSSGANLWAKSFTNHGSSEYGRGIAVDKSTDAIYLAGYALADINLGGDTLFKCGVLAKFSSSGNHVWSKSCGINNIGRASAITIDSVGNVIVGGDFQGQIDLGGGVLSGSAQYNLFIAKHTKDGNFVWGKIMPGNLDGRINSIAADSSGNLLLAGIFRGFFDFNGTLLQTTGDFSTYDGFLVKYSEIGATIWAKKFGGTGSDSVNCAAVDSGGHVVVTGGFSAGTPTFNGQPLLNAGSTDILVGRLNP